jgi:hypothetical protein
VLAPNGAMQFGEAEEMKKRSGINVEAQKN